MLAVGSAAFFLFGVVLVVLGVCQPGVSASLGLDHAGFGLLGSALSAGLGTGVLAAGPLVDRYPRRPIFLASTVVTGLALASVETGMSVERAMAHIAILGAGCGVFDTLLNAVIVERYRERSVRPMAFLHALVPVGGIATPYLVHRMGGSSEWIAVFGTTGLAFLALSVWVAFVRLPGPPRRDDPQDEGGSGEERARADAGAAAGPSGFLRPAFLALCAVGVAYIGVEAAFTLFATPYAIGALALDEAAGARAISAFWLGILLGRIVLMLPRGGVDARVLVASGLVASGATAAGVALALESVDWLLGAIGLSISAVFPVMIALAGQQVPDAAGRAVGLVAGLGSFGGFALPWLTGAIADASGIALGFGSLGLWCALIGVAGIVAHRGRARALEPAAPPPA